TNAPDTDCDNDMISPYGEWRGSTTEQQVRSGSEKNTDAEAASVLTETQRQSEPIYAWQPMSDVSPPVTHQSPLRLIRSDAHPARRMGDLCRQVSWLAARTPRPAFPAPHDWASGMCEQGSPPTVA